MPNSKIKAYLERQKAEREEKLAGYNDLIAQRDEINRKIEAYGDVSPLIAEVNEIDSLIAELEPAPEANDNSNEEPTNTTPDAESYGIDINAIINPEE